MVITHKQEQGRGQRGTIWESDAGKNSTLSILLRPTLIKPDEQFNLSKTVAVAVADFVKQHTHTLSQEGNVKVKWPNDIYIGNKKVAGILIENSVSGNKLQQSIIGIGINVNQEKFSAELPNPTSLKIISGKDFDLDKCLSQLCSCIESRYLQLSANRFEKINEDYLQNLYRFGEWANYHYKGEKLKAKIIGVTKIGKLVLSVGLLSEEKENGKRIECDFKEIIFL